MKHKARLEYEYNHDMDRIIKEIKFGVFEEKPRCFKYAGSIQDLINCQLTPNEINECLLTLGLYEDELDMQGNLTPTIMKFFKDIKRKLRKQKEMWVSDDETN